MRSALRELLFDDLEIRQRELGVDDFDVVARGDAVRHVHDVVVLETAHDVRDRVGLANVREKLVAETLAFRGARDQACDVDEFHRGRNHFLRLHDARQHASRASGTGTTPTFGSIVQNG